MCNRNCTICRTIRMSPIGTNSCRLTRPTPAVFIRQHAIDYVATFDEYDLSRCRVEPAP